MARSIHQFLTGLAGLCLAGGVMHPASADIVIRDVLDPPPAVWAWGSGDIVITDSVCVGTDQPGRLRYTITATGSGAGGSFFLQGPAPATNDVLSYTVQWNDRANQTSGVNLTAGTPSSRRARPTVDLDCRRRGAYTLNASVIVTIPETGSTGLLNAPAGAYSGILYLRVAPR
ncbi:MAG TPA: hypothetical protein EYP40_01700 [Chromatiales bacterium]|nr:hypothetical protein [Chromatiales bacterium]